MIDNRKDKVNNQTINGKDTPSGENGAHSKRKKKWYRRVGCAIVAVFLFLLLLFILLLKADYKKLLSHSITGGSIVFDEHRVTLRIDTFLLRGYGGEDFISFSEQLDSSAYQRIIKAFETTESTIIYSGDRVAICDAYNDDKASYENRVLLTLPNAVLMYATDYEYVDIISFYNYYIVLGWSRTFGVGVYYFNKYNFSKHDKG